jgi:hypothetical protein
MSDEQFNKLMYAVSLEIAMLIKPQASVKIDPNNLRGAPIDALQFLNAYADWAKVIQENLTNRH